MRTNKRPRKKIIVERSNVRPEDLTYQGAPAAEINAEQKLRRSVMSCMLFEDEFYEDGKTISNRISDLARQVPARTLADMAVEVRTAGNLRHVPLLLLAVLCSTGRGSSLVSETIAKVISRADELAEFLSIYAKINGVTPDKLKKKLSAQAKIGLGLAFRKFDEYQLAKWGGNK